MTAADRPGQRGRAAQDVEVRTAHAGRISFTPGDFFADTKDGPLDATLMSLSMLVETFGRNHTGEEYRSWLLDVGFTDVETRPFDAPAANGVVVARKP
ncbi:hypothetical protein [Streptomyces noursei]|uniref:hypothetical protein n=1 Tax=Streptomyces noursei TaxID=1971 RepID=UPI001F44431D|nr:hypothetical protein [Streptomyces noursei]